MSYTESLMSKALVAIGLVLALGLAPVTASAQLYGGKRATFLEIFPESQMTCGKRGWKFPGLINGHIPLSACILKFRGNRGSSPFGPL